MAAKILSPGEARFLVDCYYTMQANRIRAANQIRALTESGEPNTVLTWYQEQADRLEHEVHRALAAYASASRLGQWAQEIIGIGPVIAAGLLAHIDITKPTVGHIWRFAGLDPTVRWEKGKKRPWNAELKCLCWKASESFVKTSNNPNDIYGHVYAERKAEELAANAAGKYAAQAEAALAAKRFGDDTEARLWYGGCLQPAQITEYYALDASKRQGFVKKVAGAPGSGVRMLPPAHIQARAQRFAVKMFLSHFHAIGFFLATGAAPPKPWVIEHGGHVHLIDPPNMGMVPGFAEAWRKG